MLLDRRPILIGMFAGFVLALTTSAFAQVGVSDLSKVMGGRTAASYKAMGLAFLSDETIASRAAAIEALVHQQRRDPVGPAAAEALGNGVERCLNRLYRYPIPERNEQYYLRDRDLYQTFQWHVIQGLNRKPHSDADSQRRDAQHQWMRGYVANYRDRSERRYADATSEEYRQRTLKELEADFSDPMSLLFDPMPDAAFEKLKSRFSPTFTNGVWEDYHDFHVAALGAAFPDHADPNARYGYMYEGVLPFDDKIVQLYGNGPHLLFESNATFRGHDVWLSAPNGNSNVVDVMAANYVMRDGKPLAGIPGSPAMDDALKLAGRGELAMNPNTMMLLSTRGATMARLPINDWFAADAISDRGLSETLNGVAVDGLSLEGVPPANGLRPRVRLDRKFVVVLTAEKKLSVVEVETYEFGQLHLYVRPRP